MSPTDPILSLFFSLLISLARSEISTNLFKEYMSRGLYTCTASYLQTIAELQAFIKKAAEEYESCQVQMRESEKTYPKPYDGAINDMMAQWQDEDDEESALQSGLQLPESGPNLGHVIGSDPEWPNLPVTGPDPMLPSLSREETVSELPANGETTNRGSAT